MADDKKVVNTEEQNRAVNTREGENPEDSISQEPAHTVNTDTSDSSNDEAATGTTKKAGINSDEKISGRVEGDNLDEGRTIPE